jgi:bifunctional UDP-N-acetylglucosamine pyrophosphorylase / glucosamine-1-phosphate N-acetyltransferase
MCIKSLFHYYKKLKEGLFMKKNNAIILAAGKGTRMKSNLYKVLHPVLGKPMINHVIDHLNAANVSRKVMVVGHGAEDVTQVVGNQAEFVLQSEQLGTGHAVMVTESLLKDEDGTTIVICGDTPLISPETINALLNFHNENQSVATVLTTIFDDATGYGRIIRDENGALAKIVEHKDASSEERLVKEINTGTYCFDNKQLFAALKETNNTNAQGEYYLTDVIEVMKRKSLPVMAFVTNDQEETLGINDRVSLAKANQILKLRINERFMREGVTIIDPNNTYISADTTIGTDTVIYPGTMLYGHNVIGSNCIIGPNTEIRDSKIADHVEIKQSVIMDSIIGNNTVVGPFAHLRNHAQIGEDARIGNFVEIKNTVLGNKSKSAHLSYLGDAQIGENVNIGCGSITVNYNGKAKSQTIIGDNTFIGCNSNLIAPITIGKDAYVAAGSTITDPVPDDAFGIARSKQVTKELYAKKYKK